MKIYIVMVNDRHAEPEPYPFLDRDEAIKFAQYSANEMASHPVEIEEVDISENAGWHYYVTIGHEDDSVWVVEKELDKTDVDEASSKKVEAINAATVDVMLAKHELLITEQYLTNAREAFSYFEGLGYDESYFAYRLYSHDVNKYTQEAQEKQEKHNRLKRELWRLMNQQ